MTNHALRGPLCAWTAQAGKANRRNTKILIVEDDVGVRKFLVRCLACDDVDVIEAETGDEAIDLMASGTRPDLLLTDVVMPGHVQGPELASRARDLFSGLSVLFMSGYPVDMSHHAVDIAPTDRQLMKPVGHDALLATVKEMLTPSTL